MSWCTKVLQYHCTCCCWSLNILLPRQGNPNSTQVINKVLKGNNNNYIHCSLYKHSSQGCEGGGWGGGDPVQKTLTKINVQDSRLRPLYQYRLLPWPDHVMQVADSLAHHGSHLLSQLLQQTNGDEKPDNAQGGLPSGFRLTHTNCTQDTGTDTLQTRWNSLKTNKICVLKHSGILLNSCQAEKRDWCIHAVLLPWTFAL